MDCERYEAVGRHHAGLARARDLAGSDLYSLETRPSRFVEASPHEHVMVWMCGRCRLPSCLVAICHGIDDHLQICSRDTADGREQVPVARPVRWGDISEEGLPAASHQPSLYLISIRPHHPPGSSDGRTRNNEIHVMSAYCGHSRNHHPPLSATR